METQLDRIERKLDQLLRIKTDIHGISNVIRPGTQFLTRTQLRRLFPKLATRLPKLLRDLGFEEDIRKAEGKTQRGFLVTMLPEPGPDMATAEEMKILFPETGPEDWEHVKTGEVYLIKLP